MKERKFRHIPIIDKQNKLLGILSDRDILLHLPFYKGRRLSQDQAFRAHLFEVDPKDPVLGLQLKHIMRQDVVHVLPNCSFYNAVKILHERKISCLPVVDEEKTLRGIITVTDIMRALLIAYRLVEKSTINLSEKSIH